ncbi:MAG TPA: hypothetical protein VKZ87_03365 [Ferrovibrio sp.]|uniref:hypothetical protein n=1 Tax=Ferrovibrio sp. TaxID=1917215 RepID=UPI002B4B77D3|nr:hypothetical protein [Ferrovibrio sp.]HLT76405.1 hypothetical protein [Ferrovibrio sp.]
MTRCAAILFALLLAGGSILADAAVHDARAQNAADPSEWMLQFLGQAAHQTEAAYKALKAETHLGHVGGALPEILYEAHRSYVNGHGPAQGYEIVSEQTLGHRLRRVTAVMHYPKHPQLFVADFYRQTPAEGWNLIALRIETNSLNFPWQDLPKDEPVAAAAGEERRAAR